MRPATDSGFDKNIKQPIFMFMFMFMFMVMFMFMFFFDFYNFTQVRLILINQD